MIPNYPLGFRTFLGGGGQRERIPETLGHVRRSREGPSIRVRQVGRSAAMLLDHQPGVLAELQGHVVSRDKEVLPADTSVAGGLQERSAVHVSR